MIPTKDNILVRRVVASETTQSGRILLPQVAREAPSEGIVVRVGPGRMRDDVAGGTLQRMSVTAGQRVMFARGVGIEVDSDGEKLLLMGEGAVLATLEEVAEPLRGEAIDDEADGGDVDDLLSD